eukprot:1930040-Amphidinium_carterae.1
MLQQQMIALTRGSGESTSTQRWWSMTYHCTPDGCTSIQRDYMQLKQLWAGVYLFALRLAGFMRLGALAKLAALWLSMQSPDDGTWLGHIHHCLRRCLVSRLGRHGARRKERCRQQCRAQVEASLPSPSGLIVLHARRKRAPEWCTDARILMKGSLVSYTQT